MPFARVAYQSTHVILIHYVVRRLLPTPVLAGLVTSRLRATPFRSFDRSLRNTDRCRSPECRIYQSGIHLRAGEMLKPSGAGL